LGYATLNKITLQLKIDVGLKLHTNLLKNTDLKSTLELQTYQAANINSAGSIISMRKHWSA
jgi:hypothetical protein